MIQKVGVNFRQNNKPIENKAASKEDIYAQMPVRLLGFTNEVGAALSPIIGPVGELMSYVPALSYIAMDTRDKYKRGDNDDYQNPSAKKASKQLVFQMMASVIFPTAAVKAAQAIASKAVDSELMKGIKGSIVDSVQKNSSLNNFIKKFADKPHSSKPPSSLMKFAHKFEKVLNTITVAPLLFKQKQNKSGLRNLGLAGVGLTALAMVIKPIDKVSENIIEKIVI